MSRKVLSAALTVAAALGGVLAFHDGGVPSCASCHLMHPSEDGILIPPTGGPALLRDETASELCLSCHGETLGSVFGIDPHAPPPEMGGGNFVFLLEDNINDSPDGAVDPIPGEAAGHNINLPSRGIGPDSRYFTSPGGTFPSIRLECTSCHDPHGNGNFRLLRGTGPVQGGVAIFQEPAPQADGISLSGGFETATNHSAYRAGVSRWCGNCHDADYHRGNAGSAFKHRTDSSLGGGARDHYNAYNGDGDPLGGNQATAYLTAAPFEAPDVTIDSTAGPTSGARVMCLTCHRAHATSAPAAGRWDFNVALLDDDGAISGSYPIPNPYNDPAQGQLCSKCHDKGF